MRMRCRQPPALIHTLQLSTLAQIHLARTFERESCFALFSAASILGQSAPPRSVDTFDEASSEDASSTDGDTRARE